MPVSRRIFLLIAASFLATLLLSSGAASRTPASGGGNQGTASRPPTGPWTDAVSELTAKILSYGTPQGTVGLAVRNISSLSEEDVAQIRRELRSELRGRGVRLAAPKQASVEIQVTLSENVEGYVWVAEIRNGTSRDIAIVSLPRPPRETVHSAGEALSVQKVRLFEQAEPMLDFALLDIPPSAPPGQATPNAQALVLSLDGVSLYERGLSHAQDRQETAAWQLKQSASITRAGPLPRDARGRLAMGQENSFDLFLPGMKCDGTTAPTLSLTCHDGDEPWPLGTGPLPRRSETAATALAYFAANRNFFDGRIRFGEGQEAHEAKVAPFFSAAPISSKTGMLWLLASLDGRAQLLNANAESVASMDGIGSDLVSLKTGCQSGWQVLAGGSGRFDEADAVQAYEIAKSKAVAAGAPVEFAGPLTALWPLADGSGAIAISHNLKTGNYEAVRLSVHCGQ
ncbi:MAG: hypothetical protein ABSB82_08625 [Terriglobia bacterium]|jgi:hypothetical protein